MDSIFFIYLLKWGPDGLTERQAKFLWGRIRNYMQCTGNAADFTVRKLSLDNGGQGVCILKNGFPERNFNKEFDCCTLLCCL